MSWPDEISYPMVGSQVIVFIGSCFLTTLGWTCSNMRNSMVAKLINRETIEKVTLYLMLIPILFIFIFVLMILLESILLGNLPDFRNEEQSPGIIADIAIISFYVTLNTTPITLLLVILQYKFIKRIKLVLYLISLTIVALWVILNPMNIYMWFLG
jgi:hypothetical protein